MIQYQRVKGGERMKKMLEMNVDKNCKVFDDCRSYSFINLLLYHGFNFSIEDLLGFGGGITFNLINISNNKLSLYYPCGKRSDELVICCNKFGIHAIEERFKSNTTHEEMFKKISNLIDKGFPIVLNADRFYLDYLEIPRGHIGLHTIIVYGYDRNKLELYVVDMFSQNIYETTNIDIIFNAVMEEKQIPTERKYYYIKGSYDSKIEKESVYGEILDEHYRNALSTNGYLQNLKSFIGNLNNLKAQSSENRLINKFLDKQLNILINAIKMLENSGTFYRSTYCKFIVKLLEELGYNNNSISKIKNIFQKIYNNITNCNTSLGISDKIIFLARFVDLETKLFSTLEDFRNTRCKLG